MQQIARITPKAARSAALRQVAALIASDADAGSAQGQKRPSAASSYGGDPNDRTHRSPHGRVSLSELLTLWRASNVSLVVPLPRWHLGGVAQSPLQGG